MLSLSNLPCFHNLYLKFVALAGKKHSSCGEDPDLTREQTQTHRRLQHTIIYEKEEI